MERVNASPQKWHEKQRFRDHGHHREDRYEDCWGCQRQMTVCRAKRRYDTIDLAVAGVAEKNENDRYAQAVVPYFCRYCDGYHMKTARSTADKRRAAKQRSKFLVREYLSEREEAG